MEGNFSSKVRDVIQFSREEALRLGHDYIGTEHLILGIVRLGDGVAVRILKNLDCDLFKLKKTIEDTVRGTGGICHHWEYTSYQTGRKSTQNNLFGS